MSGGSYNYLCYAQTLEDLLDPQHNRLGDLYGMTNSLRQRGLTDAVEEAELILQAVETARMRVNIRLQRLTGLFKAVEWNESGDSGPERVAEAYENYKRHGKLP